MYVARPGADKEKINRYVAAWSSNTPRDRVSLLLRYALARLSERDRCAKGQLVLVQWLVMRGPQKERERAKRGVHV